MKETWDPQELRKLVDGYGWSPDFPNEECAKAIARPPLFGRLVAEDGDGCHFLLTYMEYDRVLHRLKINDDDGHAYALTAATYVVLKHNNAVPRTKPEFVEFAQGFQRWSDRVMVPATERMRVAKVDEKRENDWLLLHREQFEPAITLTMVQNERFFPADTTPDYTRLSRGMAMHDEGVAHLPHAPPPIDGPVFLGYFDVLTKPGHWLAEYGDDGLLRINELKVKTAMDAEFGDQRRSARERLSRSAGRGLVDRSTPLGNAQAADLLAVAGALAAAAGLKGREKKAAEAIRDNLPALLDKTLSRRQLAARTNISRSAIDAAWEVFRERVARTIG